MRIDLTLAQLGALKIMLADQAEDDERAWLDAIEGETDAFELVRKLLDAIEAEEGTAAILADQIDTRKTRIARCEARIKVQRDAIMAVMRCGGLEKLPLPEATLSLRTLAPKLVVNDTAAVPEEYTIPVPKPNLDAIKAAFPVDGPLPNWLRVEPERPSLTIRRK